MKSRFNIELVKINAIAKELDTIKKLTNSILANDCYSEKEMDTQIKKAQNRGNLSDDELAIIKQSWNIRKKKVNNYVNS